MLAATLGARIAAIVLPLTVATTVVGGQSSQPQSQRPVFSAAAHYVSRDVTAVDSQGRFVPDLARRDFRVFEDGVEQTIESFAKTSGGRVLTDEGPPTKPRVEGVILPATRRADPVGRILIVFIDDLHLQPADTPVTRSLLEKMRDELIREDDLIAIVSTGYSSIAVDLGYDYGHRRLNSAIKRVMGSGQPPQAIIQTPSGAGGPAALRYNAQVAFRTAFDLLEQLVAVTNRRKAFVYVSSGYDFDPFQDARLKQDQFWSLPNGKNPGSVENPFQSRREFSEADLVSQLAELIRAANRANTTFYPVDPRGLVAGPPIDAQLSFDEWRSFVQKTTGSLRVLASGTGGIAGVDRNDFGAFFQQIDAALSDYYVIGYYSSNADPLRRTRKIEIRVSRPGVQLTYRQDYSIRRP